VFDEFGSLVLGKFLVRSLCRPITRLVSDEFSQRFSLVATSMRHGDNVLHDI
jgi:hypothetical protein